MIEHKSPVGVAPQELQEEPGHGIKGKIKQKDLAIAGLAPKLPEEDSKDDQSGGRFKKLDWINLHSQRNSPDLMGIGVRENHSERRRRNLAVVITRGEAAKAAN